MSGDSKNMKNIIAVAPALIASLGVAVATFLSSGQKPWTLPVSKLSILGFSLIIYMIGVVGGLSKSISVYTKLDKAAQTDDLKQKYTLDVANLVAAVVIAAGGLALAMKGMKGRVPGMMSGSAM